MKPRKANKVSDEILDFRLPPNNVIQPKKQSSKKMPKDKRFDEYTISEPVQLLLFKIEEKEFSQTIELYDFMPKYVWGKRGIIEGNVILRDFASRGTHYTLGIHPATLVDTETGETRYEYPGRREQIIEEVLRKLAIEGAGKFLDQSAAVTFSLYEVQQELEKHNHSMSYPQIREALEILAFTRLELMNAEDKRDKIVFSPIENLGISGSGGETQTFAIFSPLVTKSIINGSFRLYNYKQVMRYRSVISRLLHKRLAHHFTQASIAHQYTITASTIVRDFGLIPQKRIRTNLNKIKAALEEMRTGVFKTNKTSSQKTQIKEFQPVILNYKVFPVGEGKIIEDYRIEITPTATFVSETIKANQVQKLNGSSQFLP